MPRQFKPRDVVADKDSRPAVEIARGEFYALSLYNETKHSVAVTVNIDGVDVFAFSDLRLPADAKFPAGKPKYSHFIIPPGGGIIPGWHRNNQKSASFEVTAYGEGASKLLKLDSTRPGVITVSFALAWKGDEIPEEEKNVRRSASGNETGFGPDVQNKLEETQMNFGVVREIVSVRYSR